MSELTRALLGYATEHVLLSAIIASVAFAMLRTRALPPEASAAALLLGLTLAIVAPLLPLPSVDPVGVTTIASTPSRSYAPVVTLTDASDDVDMQNHHRPHSESVAIDPSLAFWLMAIWLIGVAWNGTRLVRGLRGARQIVAGSRRSRQMESRYRDILPAGTEIRLSSDYGPAVVGVINPRIVIPCELVETLPESSLRAVLLHEASHLRRRDPLVYAMQMMAATLLWWSPAFRWMTRMLDAARETACDQRASRSSASAVDYAEALLDAIERMASTGRERSVQALGVTSAMNSLDRRIDDIIDEQKPMTTSGRVFVSTLALAAAGTWIAAEAALPRLEIQTYSEPAYASARNPAPTRDRPDDHEIAAFAAHQAIVDLHTEQQIRLMQMYDDHSSATSAIDADYRRARATVDAIPTSDGYEQRLSAVDQTHDDAMRAADAEFNRMLELMEREFESSLRALEADYERLS